MAKAQTEIFGLAIIIVLLMLGFIFAIYIFGKPAQKQVQIVEESALATNWLNALIKTTIAECQKQAVETLLQDCAKTIQGSIQCGSVLSCEYLQNTVIPTILSKTFGMWKREYFLNISGVYWGPTVGKMEFGSPCKGNYESKSSFIPLEGASLDLKLDICR
jgi:hypothetical protein